MTGDAIPDAQEYNRAVFSAKARDYALSRPDYPAALYEELQARGCLGPGAEVADVGAGTGLFTRGLLARGCRVAAVEPNEAMRREADAEFRGHPGYRGVAGNAEATTLPDASVDLVIAAQAFHWFDIERAPREFLRILRPAGRVALIWNDRRIAAPLHQALEDIFVEFGGARRDAVLAHEDRAQVPRFFGGAPTESLEFPHEHQLDADGLLRLVLSRSYMPARASTEGARVADRVERVFASFAVAGRVTVPYRTVGVVGRPRVG